MRLWGGKIKVFPFAHQFIVVGQLAAKESHSAVSAQREWSL